MSPTQDITTSRIELFRKRYGQQALDLASHAAFPLSLTSELLYCIRENFLPECDWYHVPDVLLSGLCDTIGYDFYSMTGKTRNRLLHHLKDNFGVTRFNQLADFMTDYIDYHLNQEGERARALGERPQWTALAYLQPSAAVEKIRQELRRIAATQDTQQRLRYAALAESYADLLTEVGFEPVLTLAERVAQGETISPGIEDLPQFSFETVFVNNRGEIIRRETHSARYFTIDLGNGVGLEMVYIPGGTFLMGSPEDEKRRSDSESPQHQVRVPPLFIAKYPTTQAQWQAVASLPQIERSLEPNPSRFKGANRPVEQVSWYDCVEFCKRLSKRVNLEIRLPSEAEWEYACRAGTTTPFHFGATLTSALANYNGNYTYDNETKTEYRGETTNVGSFPPNAFGLYDLHGNVWEWCADNWHKNYQGAPADGSAWLITNTDNDNHSQKLLRGGFWGNNPWYCRSASRDWYSADYKINYIGFRAVVSGAQ
ncbi:MAG: formylglycine-generating enzyme family protein [Oscillatoria sp. PMC 1068.18]|nr:formylglycine-generating enzyme family protein [Oscillatoria sp. PMC 1076.18]MEC4988861.1 formylglycine-generating enzyme family protein [Oscillatoria sp. PMC 1068.18]